MTHVKGQGDLKCSHLLPLQVSEAYLEDPGAPAPKTEAQAIQNGMCHEEVTASASCGPMDWAGGHSGPPALPYSDCLDQSGGALGWSALGFTVPYI